LVTTSTASSAGLNAFYDGWSGYQRALLDVIEPLSDEQVLIKPAPHQMAVWQLAAHMAGCRPYWFGILGEGSEELRDMFRVEETTVPDLPLEFAGWEDNENQPRKAMELVNALQKTWEMIDGCLRRWSPEDLQVEFSRQRMNGETQTFTRAWVVYHLMEHELHHGGEISNILGSHGLKALDDF
jgi:uncharacterized damage-inducible protein DinB